MTDDCFLEEGDIIYINAGKHVYIELPEHCVYSNKIGVFNKLATTAIKIGEPIGGMDTSFLESKYVVVKTAMEGGGIAMEKDVYPDGHHVFCESISCPELKVNFYQSGCFTAMIRPHEIQPAGKARRQWIVDALKVILTFSGGNNDEAKDWQENNQKRRLCCNTRIPHS